MSSQNWFSAALLIGASVIPCAASARPLSVEVWTDRGNDAVYKPGEALAIEARVSEDTYLLIYEIDSEGYVHVLFPYGRGRGFVEGRSTVRLPTAGSDYELVVQGPVGEGYIVALASRDPFRAMPWYLRPYDPHASDLGYSGQQGEQDDEAGVTAEGRIVGDPFVSMERIRRSVLEDPEDQDSFASSYATYYVHHEVRYPRYLCYDCHRPGHWAWWDGFDPYYARCSVFDFRVNWSWYWGRSYWNGFVPYYVYVYRSDCPPRYRSFYASGARYSSWDGWPRWRSLWGRQLTRYRSAIPRGYVAPGQYDKRRRWGVSEPQPPGFLTPRRARGDLGAPGQIPGAGDRGSRGGDRGGRGSRSGGGVWTRGNLRPSYEPGHDGEEPWRKVVPGDRSRRDERASRRLEPPQTPAPVRADDPRRGERPRSRFEVPRPADPPEVGRSRVKGRLWERPKDRREEIRAPREDRRGRRDSGPATQVRPRGAKERAPADRDRGRGRGDKQSDSSSGRGERKGSR